MLLRVKMFLYLSVLPATNLHFLPFCFLRSFSNVNAAENEEVIDDPGEADLKELDGNTSSAQNSEEPPQSHSPSTSPFPQQMSSQQSSTSKRGATSNTSMRTNDRGKFLACLEKRSAERNDLIKNLLSAEENVDEIDLFFQSIAKSVKKLPPHLQHRAKMETLNTIGKLEAEMRPSFHLPSLHYHPSPSPTPSLGSGGVSTENNPEFTPPNTQCSYSQPVHCFPQQHEPTSGNSSTNNTLDYISSNEYLTLP